MSTVSVAGILKVVQRRVRTNDGGQPVNSSGMNQPISKKRKQKDNIGLQARGQAVNCSNTADIKGTGLVQ